MKRFLYLLAVTLLLAGIVHIVIILLIPSYAAKDAWSKLAEAGGNKEFSIVSIPGAKVSKLPLIDPSFGVAACLFDLSKNPVRVNASGNLPFWSVAIFDRQGRNIYSFNDRTAIEQRLSLLVMDPVQKAKLRKNPTAESKRAVQVVSSSNKGFILIRALQIDDSWTDATLNFLKTATCSSFEIE